VQEGIDASAFAPAGARRLDEVGGQRLDATALPLAATRISDQGLDQLAFVGKEGLADARAAWELSARPVMAFSLAHGISLTLGP